MFYFVLLEDKTRQSAQLIEAIEEEEEDQEAKEKRRRVQFYIEFLILHFLSIWSQKRNRKKQKEKQRQFEEAKKTRKPSKTKYIESIESESTFKKTNQFTYVERATQTYNKYQKDRDVQTEPPKKIEFTANLSQWIIYDKYVAFEESKDKAEEIENRPDFTPSKPRRRRFLEPKEVNLREETDQKMIRCGKILERMVNQNNFDEIAIGKVNFLSCYNLYIY